MILILLNLINLAQSAIIMEDFSDVEPKIAMIDTGIEIEKVNPNFIYNKNCFYNYNIDESILCDRKDYGSESHGTIVYNILKRSIPKNSLLSFIYSSPNKTLNDLKLNQLASSSKIVHKKKQASIKINKNINDSINYAIKEKAVVVNISLSGRELLSAEINSTIKNNPNVFFVVSAGNEGLNLNDIPIYPCSYKHENLICVGSLNSNNKIAEYSNFGDDVDLYVKPMYEEGTSFSAPVISNEIFLHYLENKNFNGIKNKLIKKYSFKL